MGLVSFETTESQTAFLTLSRKGMEPERAAAAAVVSSHRLKACGSPQRRCDDGTAHQYSVARSQFCEIKLYKCEPIVIEVW